ncbi:MAG: hypothetical protein RI894_2259, partial [Bacteroidota bacterium]
MRKLVHCLLFVGLVAVFNPLKVAAQQQTILFASGQKTLSVSGKKQLDALVAQALPYYEVAGYTDSDGSEEQNLLLSQQRAAVVSDYLKGKGVASSAISLAYFGESQSINDNLNPQIKQQNRRVTVVGYPKIIQNLSEIAPPAQIFSFSPNQEIKFTEKNDIAVEIPADAFKTTSDAPINISFKNYSSKLEMILGSLSTTATDGGLLESAGMFALTALQDGKPLELQQPITYTFPKRNDSTDLDENGFGLYVGILTKGADG